MTRLDSPGRQSAGGFPPGDRSLGRAIVRAVRSVTRSSASATSHQKSRLDRKDGYKHHGEAECGRKQSSTEHLLRLWRVQALSAASRSSAGSPLEVAATSSTCSSVRPRGRNGAKRKKS